MKLMRGRADLIRYVIAYELQHEKAGMMVCAAPRPWSPSSFSFQLSATFHFYRHAACMDDDICGDIAAASVFLSFIGLIWCGCFALLRPARLSRIPYNASFD